MPRTTQRQNKNSQDGSPMKRVSTALSDHKTGLGTAAMLGAVAGAVAGAAAGVILSNEEYRERVRDVLEDLTPDTARLKKVVDTALSEKGRDLIDQGVDQFKERVGLNENDSRSSRKS